MQASYPAQNDKWRAHVQGELRQTNSVDFNGRKFARWLIAVPICFFHSVFQYKSSYPNYPQQDYKKFSLRSDALSAAI